MIKLSNYFGITIDELIGNNFSKTKGVKIITIEIFESGYSVVKESKRVELNKDTVI